MGVKLAVQAVTPARSKHVHAAGFAPGSTVGRVLCNDRPVTVPLARLALEKVSCEGCRRQLNDYPERMGE